MFLSLLLYCCIEAFCYLYQEKNIKYKQCSIDTYCSSECIMYSAFFWVGLIATPLPLIMMEYSMSGVSVMYVPCILIEPNLVAAYKCGAVWLPIRTQL